MVKDFFSGAKDRALSTIRQDQGKTDSQGLYFLIVMAIIATTLVISVAANAVGERTAANCAADYFRFCSQHPVGSPGAAQCFKANGEKLSKACVNALIADGKISKAEVDKIAREKGIASTKKEEVKEAKPSETVKASDVVVRVKGKTRNIVDRVRRSTKNVVANVKQEVKATKKAVKKATKPNKKIAAKNKKESTKRKRKLQQGGKWDGYPLFIEWNDAGREVHGNEITPYGYEDRR